MLSAKAKNITPYTAGEQPQDGVYIKLNTNENPYPPVPEIYQCLAGADFSNLRLYPDPNNVKLRQAIAQKEGVGVDNIFVGNSSDEVLALAFLTLFEKTKGALLFPDITYSFYKVWADLYDIPYKTLPLDDSYKIRVKDYLDKGSKCGIIFANPNAPTSILLERDAIESILKANKSIPVVVDEAYIEFAEKNASSVPLIKKYKNLIVVKTFSKSHSLAGARVGYAVGDKVAIDGLFRIKDCFNSYPLDRICADIATIAITASDYYNDITAKIISTRNKTADKLAKIGYTVLPSSANFLFVSHPKFSGTDIYNYLKKNKILVRVWDKPRLSEYARITIGTETDMNELCKRLEMFK
ncbi:MAG: aminotransferase class I/II-fold pyridoxal phosphate-dependent enzyme [Firmicutes bacterium]|nr:aminotransferase class I/II-fold pyridoxal phosphate-dependent enzyme [Bacillota bacterium]